MHRIAEARWIVLAFAGLLPLSAAAQADLYIRDTPADTGVQPNPDGGPMWLSSDIWIRNSPDPNYSPAPYNPASPPWTPAAHQNPEYRDPKYGLPNYVYIRVRNRGSAASIGSETLQLYWAKASTGLSWPASWVDAYGPVCGSNRLLGAEITKPRKNAATATAAERQALRDAYVQAATDPSFVFLSGYSYWTKQQHVHRRSPEHGNPAFLPWHREFLNRLELLLQEADPRVKLMYWQWTTDPTSSAGTNLYAPGFMGDSGRGTSGTTMGSVLSPALDPHPSDSGVPVVRQLSAGAPIAHADATVLARANYVDTDTAQNFSGRIEATPNHNSQHGYIGGANGDMSFPCCSTRDPFFFLLHGKVDELWARWQRSNVSRIATATAYATAATNPVLTSPQHPWDGVPNSGPAIDPWTATGGYIVSKTSFDRSVLSPPIYDTAPLTVPALAPGQEVILEIPWYPPNPAHYACLGDMRHFCLLGRVQPGIATPETSDVNANVRNNNNLAWKNIQIVDDFAGPLAALSMLVANDTREAMRATVRLQESKDRQLRLADFVEAVHIGLPPEVYKRWSASAAAKRAFVRSDILKQQRRLPAFPKGTVFLRARNDKAMLGNTALDGMALDGIELKPGERFPLQVILQLKRDYKPVRGMPALDVVQYRADAREPVGGVQVQLDVSALHLVKERAHWRHAIGDVPGDWTSLAFDDGKWREAPAPLGFGAGPEARAGLPPGTKTAYFRRRMVVQDPAFLRDLVLRLRVDDGAVVYINGKEVHRTNLPDGAVRAGTAALDSVKGAAEKAFYPVPLSPGLLRAGVNVIAVQVHQRDDGEDDLAFDASLRANVVDDSEAPSVRIALDQTLVRAGRAMTLGVDAVDPENALRRVTLFVDDKEIAGDGKGAFRWTPRVGTQRLRAVAVDGDGQTTVEHMVVTGVGNLPPKVRMRVRPGDEAGTAVLTADVVDDDGRIRVVEFFVADSARFDAKMVSVGRRTAPPYEIVAKLPHDEHRLVSVRATDDGGQVGVASAHLHEEGGHH
jgi:hypothetical protein